MKSCDQRPFRLEKNHSFEIGRHNLKDIKKNIQKYLKLFTQCRCFFELRYKHMQNVKYTEYHKLFL